MRIGKYAPIFVVFALVLLFGSTLIMPFSARALTANGGGGGGTAAPTASPFSVNGSPVPGTAAPGTYLVSGGGGTPAWTATPAPGATPTATTYGGLTSTNVAPTVPASTAGFTTGSGSANPAFPSGTKNGCIIVGDVIQTTATSVTPNDFGTLEVRTPAATNPVEIVAKQVNNEGGSAIWNNTNLGQSIIVVACQGPPYGLLRIDCHASNIVADSTSSTGPTCTTTTNNDLCLAYAAHVGSGNTITFSSIPNSGSSITSFAAAGNEVAQFNQAAAGVTTAVVAADSGTSGKGWFNAIVCISPTGN